MYIRKRENSNNNKNVAVLSRLDSSRTSLRIIHIVIITLLALNIKKNERKRILLFSNLCNGIRSNLIPFIFHSGNIKAILKRNEA